MARARRGKSSAGAAGQGVEQFLQHLQMLIPAERLPAVLRHLQGVRPACFRITAGNDAGHVLAALADEGLDVQPLAEPAGWYRVPAAQRDALTRSAASERAQIYLQNPSSFLPVRALDARPGENVLDLAAAPGGKTLLLAEAMHGEGRIAAVEPVRNRFFRLRANLALHRVAMVETYLRDGRGVGRACPGQFDRVLLDAPCSSEARIRLDDPASHAHWSLRKVREMQRKQKGLLRAGLDALKPGGVLVYSTCSFSAEENELVLNSQLNKYPGEVRVEPLDGMPSSALGGMTHWQGRDLREDLCHARRVLPDEVHDGFFLARVRKGREME